LTPPSVTNQTYTVNGIAGSFTVPEFVNSEIACDVLYSINYNNLLGWLSLPSERNLAWQTGDNFDAGEYQITIYAYTENSATTEQVIFFLIVEPDCTAQIISASEIDNQVFTYKVGDPSTEFELDLWLSSALEPVHLCPITYEVRRDSTLTWMIDLERGVTVDTSDPLAVGTYDVVVMAKTVDDF